MFFHIVFQLPCYGIIELFCLEDIFKFTRSLCWGKKKWAREANRNTFRESWLCFTEKWLSWRKWTNDCLEIQAESPKGILSSQGNGEAMESRCILPVFVWSTELSKEWILSFYKSWKLFLIDLKEMGGKKEESHRTLLPIQFLNAWWRSWLHN